MPMFTAAELASWESSADGMIAAWEMFDAEQDDYDPAIAAEYARDEAAGYC